MGVQKMNAHKALAQLVDKPKLVKILCGSILPAAAMLPSTLESLGADAKPNHDPFAGYYQNPMLDNSNTSPSTATFSDQSSETSMISSPPVAQGSLPAAVFPQPNMVMPWMTNEYQQVYNYQQAYQNHMRAAMMPLQRPGMPQFGTIPLLPVEPMKPIENVKSSLEMSPPPSFSVENLRMPDEMSASPEPIETSDLERQISIEPKNLDLWKKFKHLENEMIITKSGRNLFPKLEFVVKGLESANRYLFALTFKRIGTCKYKYYKGEWQSAGKADDDTDMESLVYHSSNIRYPLGKVWMATGLSFDELKLTNTIGENKEDIFCLRPMHKYRPVVIVLPVYGTGFQRIEKEIEIADFIAVTAYQNNAVTSLKIGNNPFAKGFRKERNTERLQPTSTSLAQSLGMPNGMYPPYSLGGNAYQQNNLFPYSLFSSFSSYPYYMQGMMPMR